MNNKICLITGGNSGIGKATAMELARKGATVVLICRSKERGTAAVKEIIAQSGNEHVDLIVADLAVQKEVRRAADEFKSKYSKLDVLINNAAVFLSTRSETVDGIESTFAINYLSHFILTQLLLDSLEASGEGRIINVASKTGGTKMNFDDLMTSHKYSFLKAVGPTKLGLVLFTKELAARLKGRPITVNSLHPGLIKSNLLEQIPWLLRKLFHAMSTTPEKGAKTPVYLATSPEVKGISGQFFANCKPAKTSAAANDPENAKRLWDVSMSLIRPDVL